MDRLIKHPWYIDRKNVYFFYEPIAVNMALCSNDIESAVELTYS